MEISITPQAAGYSEILALDWKMREFVIPPILRLVDNDGLAPNHPVGMQQALTMATRETGPSGLSMCPVALLIHSSSPSQSSPRLLYPGIQWT